MARRILEGFMREAIYASDRKADDQKYGMLEIDQPVTLQFNGPQEVCVFRTGQPHLTRGLQIGRLNRPEDIDWMRHVVPSAYTARIHSAGMYDHSSGGRIYEIEVLSGQDHDVLVADRRRSERVELAKLHWWKPAMLVIAIYILFS